MSKIRKALVGALAAAAGVAAGILAGLAVYRVPNSSPNVK